MPQKQSVLILVNPPHRPQMERLKAWLEKNLDMYNYKIVNQWVLGRLISKKNIKAIITYNKNKYKSKTIKRLIEYTENGGKLISLHHNISSMHLSTPQWLKWSCVRINKGSNVEDPWGVDEGGDAYLIPLVENHFILHNGITYSEKVPDYTLLAEDEEGKIKSHQITTEGIAKISGKYKPALAIRKTEYFINHILYDGDGACNSRRILMAIYYENKERNLRYYSKNAMWYMKKGKGLLFYSMIGHSVGCYTDQYCRLIANMIEFYPENEG